MKKLAALLLSLMLLICCLPACAEEEAWTCPGCGASAAGNFCSKCGTKRPDEGPWLCPGCGTECTENFCPKCGTKRPDAAVPVTAEEDLIRLDLDIAFAKNAYFSTYDVKLFVDNEWVATLRHGVDYACTLYVTPGRHVLLFREDGSSYPAEGSAILSISGPTLYQCELHAKIDAVQITREKTEAIADDTVRNAPAAIFVDGSLQLQLRVEFRKNGLFSQYDVDLYCDDTLVATLPHGKDFEGVLLVSEGTHMLTFCRSGDRSIRGSCTIQLTRDASFSCKIEAERNKVDIKNDRLTY